MTPIPDANHRPSRSDSIPVVGAALLSSHDGSGWLYACRRVAPPWLAGRWELPGGKVEPGESWQEALDRELAEELSVAVTVRQALPGPLPDGTWHLPRGYRMGVWLAEPVGTGPVPGADHDAHRWLTADDLGSVDWLPGDEPIVAALRAWMRAAGSSTSGWPGPATLR